MWMIVYYLPYGSIRDENLVDFMIERWEKVCYIVPLFQICLFQGILSWGMCYFPSSSNENLNWVTHVCFWSTLMTFVCWTKTQILYGKHVLYSTVRRLVWISPAQPVARTVMFPAEWRLKWQKVLIPDKDEIESPNNYENLRAIYVWRHVTLLIQIFQKNPKNYTVEKKKRTNTAVMAVMQIFITFHNTFNLFNFILV
jgi:hypothetical protein